MKINVSPNNIYKKLLFVAVALLIGNILGLVSKLYFDHDHMYGLIPFFDFNSENNLPTYFSTMLLFVASYLLTVIALTHKKNQESYFSWLGLAFIFLFLSIDEMASVHEQLSIPMREMFSASGILYFAWVIPYGVALIVFLIAYLKFLRDLPKKIMFLFLISGTVFVSGALGLEFIGGWYLELHGKHNLIYSMLFTCEEFLEMFGVILFIYTLLTYIATLSKEVKITLESE